MYPETYRQLLGDHCYKMYGYEKTPTSTISLIVYGDNVMTMIEYDPLGKLSQKEKEAVWISKSSTTTSVA